MWLAKILDNKGERYSWDMVWDYDTPQFEKFSSTKRDAIKLQTLIKHNPKTIYCLPLNCCDHELLMSDSKANYEHSFNLLLIRYAA